MGADKVEDRLRPLLRAVTDAGHPVVWACDPMHGNTFTASSGRKTRHFDDIVARDRRLRPRPPRRGHLARRHPRRAHRRQRHRVPRRRRRGARRRPRRPLRDDLRPAPQRPPERRPRLPASPSSITGTRLTSRAWPPSTLVATWPVDHVAAAVVGADGDGARRGRRPDRRFRLASITKMLVGLGGAGRRRGRHRRPRPAGRPARLHAAAPARPRRRVPVRRRRAGRPARAHAGSTPTPASSWRPRPSPRRAGIAVRRLPRRGGAANRSAMTATTLDGSPRPRRRSTVGDLSRLLAELQRADVALGAASATRRDHVQYPALSRYRSRGGPIRSVPVGPGLRDPRRQVTALDRHNELAAHVRTLRRGRHDDVGRSRPSDVAWSRSPTERSTRGPRRCACWPALGDAVVAERRAPD